MDDLKQKVDQCVDHPRTAVHEMERKETQPARVAVAAHLGRSLSIDAAGQALNQSGIDIGHGVERQTERVHECQSRCRRQDALQRGGTRIGFQTQKPRRASCRSHSMTREAHGRQQWRVANRSDRP